ncbi:hypothetical protein Pryu01_03001 [Paraliobacillus ryukyuensis]|uniref:Minor capsid protein n=1 Tax=Paraliobacillus ryukyuensis TaxID=200904 RepID=A0A366DPP9_9BACI|nr:minor capsid protein [Paraliobacillus ryukyuensis]RBO92067.1 minor capsid protein [Paraliobacillus ryukyuensis]
MLNVKVEWFDIDKKMEQASMLSQKFIDNEVLKDSNFYIPKDHGYLEESGITHTKIGSGQVSWQEVYARRLYYNPQYNFSKDKNPNARGLWFEEAKAQNLDDWIKGAEEAFKQGF